MAVTNRIMWYNTVNMYVVFAKLLKASHSCSCVEYCANAYFCFCDVTEAQFRDDAFHFVSSFLPCH